MNTSRDIATFVKGVNDVDHRTRVEVSRALAIETLEKCCIQPWYLVLIPYLWALCVPNVDCIHTGVLITPSCF